MARVMVVGTVGTENPTRASLPFVFAKGVVEAGDQPTIVLTGDASVLGQEANRNAIQGVGFPALRELVAFLQEHNVPVFV